MFKTKEEMRTFLVGELARRKEANPLYSLRAFARQVDLSAGAFSQILSGKRNIGPKTFRKLNESINEIVRGPLEEEVTSSENQWTKVEAPLTLVSSREKEELVKVEKTSIETESPYTTRGYVAYHAPSL